jgi:hypothetical protein
VTKVELFMTKIVISIRNACRTSLQSQNAKIVGLIAAGSGLIAAASAETFNFSILGDLVDAIVLLIPDANTLIDQGGPLVIKFCIVAAVCAPFIWLYSKAHGKK